MNIHRNILMLAVFLFFCAGCTSIDARKEFANGAKIYTDKILPEYKRYINNDVTLDEKSKKIRERTANEFEKYINEYAK